MGTEPPISKIQYYLIDVEAQEKDGGGGTTPFYRLRGGLQGYEILISWVRFPFQPYAL